jgi:hypothetical protein
LSAHGKLLLELNGKVLVPDSAEMSLNFATDTWDEASQDWVYGDEHICPHWQLDVGFANYSGEDGAPAPSLCYLIPHEFEIPPPDEFPGLRFSDPENRRCEAWYGNDAPAIVENQLAFGSWVDLDHIEVEWTGKYHDWETQRRDAPFRLSGAIAFKGITARVREESDAVKFLRLLVPRIDVTAVRQAFGHRPPGWEADPGDRRYRLPVTWTRSR